MKYYGYNSMVARISFDAHKMIKDVCFYKNTTVSTFVIESTLELAKKMSNSELRKHLSDTPYGRKQLVMNASPEFHEFVRSKAEELGVSMSMLMATCAYQAAKKTNIAIVVRTKDKRLA
jgi:uncharacterized protein (DUF1778 family)